jgi:hypothetical protein
MIVTVHSDCLEVITHYAHGLQAGQIALNLKEEFRPPYWLETLTAIIEHDDEQINFEKNNNLTKLGFPSDYRLVESDPKDILERCHRIMNKCKSRSGWEAILVSMHLECIYEDLINSRDDFKSFFQEWHELRKNIRKLYSVNAVQCEEYYQVLRFCDRLSLILSQGDIPSDGRNLEINQSINGERYFVSGKKDVIHVEPSPFAQEFILTTEVYKLEKIQFKSSDQLQEHLYNSLPVLKTWKIAN